MLSELRVSEKPLPVRACGACKLCGECLFSPILEQLFEEHTSPADSPGSMSVPRPRDLRGGDSHTLLVKPGSLDPKGGARVF